MRTGTYGRGPEQLVELLTEEWQPERPYRQAVPDVVEDPDLESGVLIIKDRKDVHIQHSMHDVVHCYHPQASGLNVTDRGFKEQNVVENVQIDVELTDRNDAETGERLSARERMIGNGTDQGGIFNEVKHILESVRRGFETYDEVSHTLIRMSLRNSNADVSFDVELERIAENTVQ